MAGASGKRKYTRDQVIRAVVNTGGIKTAICGRLGCSRMTLDRYLREDQEILGAYTEECERVTDMAKSALYSAIENKQPWAIMFYLERRTREFSRLPKNHDGEAAATPVEVRIVRQGKQG